MAPIDGWRQLDFRFRQTKNWKQFSVFQVAELNELKKKWNWWKMQHVNSRGFTCNWTSSSANTWRWPGPRRRRCTCSIFQKLQTFKRRLSISYVLVVEQRGGGNFGRLRFAQRDVNFIHRLFEWVKQSPKAIIVESRKKNCKRVGSRRVQHTNPAECCRSSSTIQ